MPAIRVLHVLARLDRGGTETWLVKTLRHLNRADCACDFLVLDGHRGAYEAEVEAAGARIFRCPHPTQVRAFGSKLTSVLRNEGLYDVVHSHIDPCGLPLRWAYAEGIPVRVAHAHNPGWELRRHPLWLRYALSGWTRRLIARYSTVGLATSQTAGQSVFGRIRAPRWSWQVLHCGVDLEPLRTTRSSRAELLMDLQLPPNAQVLLHVGKFCESRQKNQEFLLEVLRALRQSGGGVWGVFLGDGPRRPAVERLAEQLGIAEFVRFAGSRGDVPDLLQNVADVFVFPSRFEGLGLALVEAQAAGRPCVVSDAVPTEAIVVPELVDRLPLSADPHHWAARIQQRLQAPSPIERAASWRQVAASSFNISRSAETLCALYRAWAPPAGACGR